MKILIIGKGYVGERCAEAWPEAALSGERLNTRMDVSRLLERHKPDAVLNAAGVVGKPNVDWCEHHPLETMRGNTILPLLIADACQERQVYMLHIGTGCIFYGPAPAAGGWKETDFGNPVAVYTRCKYAADLGLSVLPQVGIARIRMPIDYRPSPRNLIDKLASFPKVIDVCNSVTVVEDMVAVFRELLERRAEGIFHVTNPGTISHREILEWYKELVDPAHTNEWISEEELVRQGLAERRRSTNELNSTRLEALGIAMRPVKEAVRDTLRRYAAFKQPAAEALAN